jgi:signal transduction histidine kinase
MMQKLTFQIVDPSRDVFDRITREELDSIVRVELKNRDLDIEFSYGISKGKPGNWKYLSSNADSVMLKYSDYKLMLFPNDVFKSNEMLSISFRDRLNYLLDGIWVMMLFSLAFTGIIIWGFTYTIKVILRQKKLADIKNDFINNMTHEFKTPIATIALANESMRNPRIFTSSEKMEFYNNIIRDENQRMLRQVETVLQMAQIDKGELKFNLEICDLNELVENAISSMQLTVEQRNGVITFNKMKETPLVKGDPNHLSNVFINILDNANKYTIENPVIAVSSYAVPGGYCVEIADNGIGMSKDVVKRIFDNFYRATSGNIHDVKGFGLGLSYVKAIVDDHGGTIQVSSEPGKGSNFKVILPEIKD